MRAAAVALVTATFLAAAAASAAPSPQRPSTRGTTPQPPPPAAGSLAGTVVVQDGNAPVARARIILASPAVPQSRVTLSDARGQFTFTGVPAGDYDLTVMRTGYAIVGGSARGLAVRIGGGEQRAGLTITLQRSATIAGRVEDEDGTPLAGAQVEALSLRAPEAQKPLVPAALTTTDDRGEFRLTGLAAGQYYVIARDAAFAKAGDEGGALRYPATYYPGVVVEADARPVSVSAGAETPRIEFRIQIVKPAHVAGLLKPPDNRPLLSGAVVLVPRDGVTLHRVPSEDVDIRPDGRFAFRNVPPGSYQLRARAATDPRQVLLFGSFAVQVEAGISQSDVVVTLAPGAVVHGQLEWSGDGAKAAAARGGLRVRAPFADGTSFGDALTGEVTPDGRFRLRGIMTGSHLFAIEGLPEPWTLARVRFQGRESAVEPFEVHEGEQMQSVHLIVTTRATDVTGQIADDRGRPAADALILFAPAGATQWVLGDPRFQMTRADDAGRYRMRRLPPGPYRVAGLVAVDELAAWRPEWFGRLQAHSQSLDVADAAAPQTLHLVAVPPHALPAAVSR